MIFVSVRPTMRLINLPAKTYRLQILLFSFSLLTFSILSSEFVKDKTWVSTCVSVSGWTTHNLKNINSNYRSDVNHKITHSHILIVINPTNPTFFQSYTLPISHSSNPTLFRPVLHSSNLTLFQSYTLPILHSNTPTHQHIPTLQHTNTPTHSNIPTHSKFTSLNKSVTHQPTY